MALGKAFKVRDMPRKTGHKRHDSNELFERDQKRLGADEIVTGNVKQICSQVTSEFPEVGYNQVSGGAPRTNFDTFVAPDTPKVAVCSLGIVTLVSSCYKFLLQSGSAAGFAV